MRQATSYGRSSMIRYIVETISSERDVYGNRYHFARVTSTKTGHSLVIDGVGGDRNAPITVSQLLDLYGGQVWETQSHLPIRDWQRHRKYATTGEYVAVYSEGSLTATDLRRLNRKVDVYGERKWREQQAS